MNARIRIAVLAATCGLSMTARAEEKIGPNHPCKAIKEACEAAGFKLGDHKDKKGLWKDCIEPIKNGQTVAGVTVPATEIEACKAKKAEKKK